MIRYPAQNDACLVVAPKGTCRTKDDYIRAVEMIGVVSSGPVGCHYLSIVGIGNLQTRQYIFFFSISTLFQYSSSVCIKKDYFQCPVLCIL